MNSGTGGGWGPEPGQIVERPARRILPAASLVLAHRDGVTWRFLMGRRASDQRFLPGYFVFPGGRLEAGDRVAHPSPLPDPDARRIARAPGTRANERLGHRLAVCALRETREETGFDLAATGLKLRLLARAITPPRTIRRYDTRFFLGIIADPQIARQAAHDLPDGELEAIGWYRAEDLPAENVMRITGLIMDQARARLADDPGLDRDVPVPCHRFVRGKPVMNLE